MNNEFPQMLYRAPGPLPIHGGMFDTLIVNDETERADALAAGWFATTPEAGEAAAEAASEVEASKAASTDSTKPPTREELEQKAAELGIPFSARVSDKKLAEAIAAKLAEPVTQ